MSEDSKVNEVIEELRESLKNKTLTSKNASKIVIICGWLWLILNLIPISIALLIALVTGAALLTIVVVITIIKNLIKSAPEETE
tara:strand:+ start:13944 stop:14195 length:252 start_codon:yes stop_codon:yes gene_type:complete